MNSLTGTRELQAVYQMGFVRNVSRIYEAIRGTASITTTNEQKKHVARNPCNYLACGVMRIRVDSPWNRPFQ